MSKDVRLYWTDMFPVSFTDYGELKPVPLRFLDVQVHRGYLIQMYRFVDAFLAQNIQTVCVVAGAEAYLSLAYENAARLDPLMSENPGRFNLTSSRSEFRIDDIPVHFSPHLPYNKMIVVPEPHALTDKRFGVGEMGQMR